MAPLDSLPRVHDHHVVVSIDDEPGVLSALRRLLRNEPYEFLATQEPDQALDWVLQKQASLILADQRMPAISGVDLLELVKLCSPSTIRVILTAHSDLTGVMNLRKIEAIERLLRKPWDGEELRRIVRDLLAEHERRMKASPDASSPRP